MIDSNSPSSSVRSFIHTIVFFIFSSNITLISTLLTLHYATMISLTPLVYRDRHLYYYATNTTTVTRLQVCFLARTHRVTSAIILDDEPGHY